MKIKLFFILFIAFCLFSCAPSQKKIQEQQEKDPQYQYKNSMLCMNYGLYDEALKYIKKTLILDPQHFPSYNLQGLAYSSKNEKQEAIKSFQKCIEINPNFSEAHHNLGVVYEELGQIDQAEQEYKKAFEIDENYNASYQLAKIYYTQNKLELALEYVDKSLNKFRMSLFALNLKGLLLDRLGRSSEAIEYFLQALKIAPNEINMRFNLAYAYFNNKEYGKAKDILERLLKEAKDKKALDQINELLKLIREKVASA